MATETPGSLMVRRYRASDRDGVLMLLYVLHGSYKDSIVPPYLRQFGEDRDLVKAYSEYMDIVERGHGEQYMTLVAESEPGRIVGVIIGSTEDDEWDVLTPIGILEDWFVTEDHRRTGVGSMLYQRLEEWFRSRGCRQVKSDTWMTNHLSRDVHGALGFVEYGVDLRKRL
jgi:aminoglycoside 6'-N-acetyltransferase I